MFSKWLRKDFNITRDKRVRRHNSEILFKKTCFSNKKYKFRLENWPRCKCRGSWYSINNEYFADVGRWLCSLWYVHSATVHTFGVLRNILPNDSEQFYRYGEYVSTVRWGNYGQLWYIVVHRFNHNIHLITYCDRPVPYLCNAFLHQFNNRFAQSPAMWLNRYSSVIGILLCPEKLICPFKPNSMHFVPAYPDVFSRLLLSVRISRNRLYCNIVLNSDEDV